MRSESRRNCGHTGGGDTGKGTKTEKGTDTQREGTETEKGTETQRTEIQIEKGGGTVTQGERTETQRKSDGLRKDRGGGREIQGEGKTGMGKWGDSSAVAPQTLIWGAPDACSSPARRPRPCPDMQASHCWSCGRRPGNPGPRRRRWASRWCASHCPTQSPQLPQTHPLQPLTGGHSGDARTGTSLLWGGWGRGSMNPRGVPPP